VANRTLERAERLADSLRADGLPARAVALDRLPAELALADLAVTCTGAVGTVLTASTVAEALGHRGGRRLVICDLGLPRDTDAGVAQLPGITMFDLASLNQRLAARGAGEAEDADDPVRAARQIVADELSAYLAAQRSAEVTPTVTALRRRAAEVVDAELLRMSGRLPDLSPEVRDELAHTVRRVVDKLLHTPTVRVKQLAEAPGGDTYAEALRELFGLDPQAPAAVVASRVGGARAADAEPVDGIALDRLPKARDARP
jgi:glutamyl-tRNA reductase